MQVHTIGKVNGNGTQTHFVCDIYALVYSILYPFTQLTDTEEYSRSVHSNYDETFIITREDLEPYSLI